MRIGVSLLRRRFGKIFGSDGVIGDVTSYVLGCMMGCWLLGGASCVVTLGCRGIFGG